MGTEEKRGAERFACDGGVEVRSAGSPNGFWGTLTDISLTGCYVSSFSPLPVGTEVDVIVHIKHNNMEFKTRGLVKTFHPGVGMGLLFTALEPSEQETLHKIITEMKMSKA